LHGEVIWLHGEVIGDKPQAYAIILTYDGNVVPL